MHSYKATCYNEEMMISYVQSDSVLQSARASVSNEIKKHEYISKM